jgi:hypothetical protein
MEYEIQRLTQLAANAKSPHVRRVAGLVRLALEGLKKAGIPWEARARYVSINNGVLRGRYLHPHRAPRRRGALVIQKMRGTRLGPIVRTISTLPEAIDFYKNPRLPI